MIILAVGVAWWAQ